MAKENSHEQAIVVADLSKNLEASSASVQGVQVAKEATQQLSRMIAVFQYHAKKIGNSYVGGK